MKTYARQKTYAVKEVFATVQGEGYRAGTPSIFLRFSGCNVWSGFEEDRVRDARKGRCALWCDTDFVGGSRMTAGDIVKLIEARTHGEKWVVVTGGEPGLQLDAELVSAIRVAGMLVAVESNGTCVLPDVDWLCVSPKPPAKLAVKHCDEVKVVIPGFNPESFAHLSDNRFVQPKWTSEPDEMRNNIEYCVDYVKHNTGWRLSLQAHKYIGVP